MNEKHSKIDGLAKFWYLAGLQIKWIEGWPTVEIEKLRILFNLNYMKFIDTSQ